MEPENRWEVQQFVTQLAWMWCGHLVPFPGTRINTPWLMTVARRRLMITEYLLKDQSSGRSGMFRESLSLHLLFSKCLQLKIINITRRHILRANSAALISVSLSIYVSIIYLPAYLLIHFSIQIELPFFGIKFQTQLFSSLIFLLAKRPF